jgi:hypothetical protein
MPIKRGCGRGVPGALRQNRKTGYFSLRWRLRRLNWAVFSEDFAKKWRVWADSRARRAAKPVRRSPNAERGQPPQRGNGEKHLVTAVFPRHEPHTVPWSKIRGGPPLSSFNHRAGAALGRGCRAGMPNPRRFASNSPRRGQPLSLTTISYEIWRGQNAQSNWRKAVIEPIQKLG